MIRLLEILAKQRRKELQAERSRGAENEVQKGRRQNTSEIQDGKKQNTEYKIDVAEGWVQGAESNSSSEREGGRNGTR